MLRRRDKFVFNRDDAVRSSQVQGIRGLDPSAVDEGAAQLDALQRPVLDVHPERRETSPIELTAFRKERYSASGGTP
jgi:hypothetical protein